MPTGRRYEALTQIGLGPPPRYVPYPLAELADDMPAAAAGDRLGPPLPPLLAPLARASKSELAVVRRVEDYLLREGRFHYTTDVGDPGIEPLMEFLFHTHAGYCQHFAGAAALLLRVAGVPTRVVVGFATGEQIGHAHLGGPRRGRPRLDRGLLPGRRLGPLQPDPGAPPPADVSPGLDVLQAERRRRRRERAAAPFAAGGRRRRRSLAPRPRRHPPGPPPPRPAHPARRAPGPARPASPPSPGTTLRSLHPTLTEIGPATADLALVAERARFAADRPAPGPPTPA